MLVTPLNFLGNKLWSFRRSDSAGRGGRSRQRPCSRRWSASRRDATPPRAAPGSTARTQAIELFLADPKVGVVDEALPAETRHHHIVHRRLLWTIDVSSSDASRRYATGDRRDDQTGTVRSGRGRGHKVLWTMARGGFQRRVRRQADRTRVTGVARVLRDLSCSASSTGGGRFSLPNGRPAGAPVVLGAAVVLQPRRRLHVDAARLSRVSCGCSGGARGWAGATARRADRGRCGLCGCSSAATVCLVGYRIDLNLHHSNVVDVGYGGVIGADRISRRSRARTGISRADRAICRRAGRRTRPARSATAPFRDQRPLRDGQPRRGYLRPGRLRGVPPRLPPLRVERQVGRPPGLPRDRDPRGPDLHRRALARR